MDVSTTIKKFGIEQALNYLYKDPQKNMLKLMDWADKFSHGEFVNQRRTIRDAVENPEHPYHSYIMNLISNVDPEVLKLSTGKPRFCGFELHPIC